jgi:hypothetical protein
MVPFQQLTPPQMPVDRLELGAAERSLRLVMRKFQPRSAEETLALAEAECPPVPKAFGGVIRQSHAPSPVVMFLLA